MLMSLFLLLLLLLLLLLFHIKIVVSNTFIHIYSKNECNETLMKQNKNFNDIWEKVSKSVKKEFDGEPVYDEKYLKNKIKSYQGKISINFQNNKIPKEHSQCICLLVILINSVFRKQVIIIILKCFSKNVNMLLKKKKIPKYIFDGIRNSSDKENSEKEDSDEKNSDEKNKNTKKKTPERST